MIKYKVMNLNEEEKNRCYENWDDMRSKEIIFEANIPFAVYMVNRYYSTSDPDLYDELIQTAVTGLWKGVKSYKPDSEAKLSSYTGRCIINEIRMFFRRRNRQIATMSLDEVLNGYDDTLSLSNVVTNDDDFTEEIDRNCIINDLITYLNEDEKQLVLEYYFMNYTQARLAEIYNVKQSAISRRLKKIASKLNKVYIRNYK